ncbi:MAG: diaminopimelate decarboxylase [Senegalia sp. (in: firmicutes)]|uniref:diaminopimelate decarboxylase n=1 Tax=Senegalia sp. (in: firmicutes) TaxID=1924098 RepID=UPI003F9D85D4
MSIQKSKNHLYIGGCDAINLAKEYGTPLYVVNQEEIEDRCREIREVFLNKFENTRAFYASKAFLTLAMCKIIEKEGLGLDVVSGGELYTALKADFPPEKILFHGNNKSFDELEFAIENNVNRIVVDNTYELDLIEKIASKLQREVSILFRLTPGITSITHENIDTGRKDSKFGIPLEKNIILNAVKQSIDSKFINLKGFHFHMGSQLFDSSTYLKAIDIVFDLIKYLKKELEFEIQELNTGGGYGISYIKEDKEKNLEYFINDIMNRIYKKSKEYNLLVPQVMIEPGRWIVGHAGTTLYTIGNIKNIKGVRTYASVDGGMTDNPRPSLYSAKYYGEIANKMNEEKKYKVTIAGKCCESGDILIRDLQVPKITNGDILAVYNTGAYNFSMSSNYNKTRRAAVVLVNKDESEIIVERQSYEDLLRGERVPKEFKNY